MPPRMALHFSIIAFGISVSLSSLPAAVLRRLPEENDQVLRGRVHSSLDLSIRFIIPQVVTTSIYLPVDSSLSLSKKRHKGMGVWL